MPKKCLRSAFVKRPFPSAILAAIDRAARLSWSARKKYPRGKCFVRVHTVSANATDFWYTINFSKAKDMHSPLRQKGESGEETAEER